MQNLLNIEAQSRFTTVDYSELTVATDIATLSWLVLRKTITQTENQITLFKFPSKLKFKDFFYTINYSNFLVKSNKKNLLTWWKRKLHKFNIYTQRTMVKFNKKNIRDKFFWEEVFWYSLHSNFFLLFFLEQSLYC